ncbi:TonB-dependent receptor [Pseudoalteromonas sp. MER144-MNA-CIBAN-0113]|uniref:TonB-dependent receptor n=1 Tax=Pseudoalteromonas sp. MER144-MNA-CIBAN-0113 TaxID=3140429 RepID=UPI00332E82EC
MQLGGRVERVTIDADNVLLPNIDAHAHNDTGVHDDHAHEEHAGNTRVFDVEQEFTPVSLSTGVVWDFAPSYNLGLSVSRSERAPSVSELLSFGPHIGTGTYEVGALFDIHEDGHFGLSEQALDLETANNIDLTFRKTQGDIGFILNAFYNQVDNYYYQIDTGLYAESGHDHGDEHNHDHGDEHDHQHDDEYEAEKIANIAAVGDLRIGSIYGHEDSEAFIGVVSGHGGGPAVLLSINPAEAEMEEFEWQLADGASAVSYSFSANGEHFLVLDSLGFLNVLEAHAHDGEIHWELTGQVYITQEDVTTMPEGMKFSMTVAQNGQFAYVADPIAQHVVQVHLEDLEIEGELELTFPPAAITWLGIAQEEEHAHEH